MRRMIYAVKGEQKLRRLKLKYISKRSQLRSLTRIGGAAAFLLN